MYNTELMHYGVKGMKWGVRKARRKASKTVTPKRNLSDDYIRAEQIKKKHVSEMSNAELREVNSRMQLESQYHSLNKQHTSGGKKFVKDIAQETAKSLVKDYTKQYAKKGVQYVLSLGSK